MIKTRAQLHKLMAEPVLLPDVVLTTYTNDKAGT